MELSKVDTQNKIILTAMDMIGKQINLDFTIREIADRANVNLASVNYYFRSKENLINEVENRFAQETQQIYRELDRPGISPRERTIRWAEEMMLHLMKYPGILFMMVTKLIQKGIKSTIITGLLDNVERRLAPIIRELTGAEDDLVVSMKLLQLLSGVVTPVLFYHAAGNTFEFDINNSSSRLKYVESLVGGLLK